jgi:hypothetical protein
MLGQGRGMASCGNPGNSPWYPLSLTLHEPYGKRIMGYDNSHAVKLPKKFKYAGQWLAYDHKHRHISDKGIPYEFKDAYQLLADFFEEVDRVLKEMKL